MELKWYIDSWAPTEGVAFVSKREPCEDPWALEHMATLMIRAPDFEPRPVDRTFAFGAARRGFQERFAIEGLTEYGFDSLDYLTTFVSRIYLGSGPGTGGGGEFPVEGGPGPKGNDGNLRNRREELPQVTTSLSSENQGRTFRNVLKEPREKRLDKIEELLDKDAFHKALHLLDMSAREAHSPQDRIPYRNKVIPITEYPLVIGVPLPRQSAQILTLPEKIRSFMDLMSYLAADREVVARLSIVNGVPLLLATAIQFYFQPSEAYYYGNGRYYEAEWWYWHYRFRAKYAQFMVDWLPFDELPSELEQTLQNWNQLTFEEQRRNSHQG